ncbi:flippase-like domain-containing protein [Prevotella brunnea]|uniref:Flippase-like domain-containing protein n=1 Tax=Prevotella brunnea TaxID=2508867 RepID=A0A5C8GCX3_9BACT|nr:lysylphosphatidylglycerol synthase transmembrane domain-containing protein [Prevotella brunnea]MDR0186784.1 flippase-like domain-containing protein [Prevotella brunnea]TXJ59717.1 flippase-like domain-containing protein [Prevotella brunnea]
MRLKKLLYDSIKIILPLILGGSILYWMYRDFDFAKIENVLLRQMNWTWMLLSLPFGVLAQAFRGWRWRQTLEPLGERPRNSVSVNSIFLSYAVSLIIPRVGEFARCGVLHRYDKVAFPKALGTVVTERAVDTIIVVIITALAFLSQISVFGNFFSKTGTRMDHLAGSFSAMGWLVTTVCAVAAMMLLYVIRRKLTIHDKVKETLSGIWQGIISLKGLKNVPLFLFYSFAIWASYFLHFYLTFFCFEATSNLGVTCALLCFVVGSIAVIVPTPNGAGPWHFAVKTMLILYGIADVQALYFVLIVHTVQTLLVVLLGIYAWIALAFTRKKAVGDGGQPTSRTA